MYKYLKLVVCTGGDAELAQAKRNVDDIVVQMNCSLVRYCYVMM